MTYESRCPVPKELMTRMKHRLAELEALAAVGLLEEFSLEDDELLRLRSLARVRTIDWGELDAPVPMDDLEL